VEDARHKLKLGKGVTFVKGQLRRLPQGEDTWEADFMEAARSGNAHIAGWAGLVISHHGLLLAERTVEESPTVNDMARLLTDAMRRPLAGEPHRPRTLRIRSRKQWQPLLPHLGQLGLRVISAPRLAKWDTAFKAFARNVMASGPAAAQSAVEGLYPTIAKWVRTHGWVEIGDQQGFGFVARALDYGGLVFEDTKATTLSEAMSALERGIADYIEEQLGPE